ncbi:nucleotidyltransferase family protein [Methylococcus sp. Mc7]|uniref:nucleotidyltransferase family protein n=1 Tax=Methylococcus sp. Mc7 TaxID=2860258 RepID=UPI0021081E85|nr:nucleotidyltransferase family protein [Methylococcus sp. Mc7]
MDDVPTPSGQAPSAKTVAASLFYEHRLSMLGKEFAAVGLAPVIVKGQAVVDLAFPKGEIRLAGDVDILVGDEAEAVVDVLTGLGYEEIPPHSTHFHFVDRSFVQQGKRLPNLVELHRCLDKILLRPIPYDEILTRAKPSGRPGFRYPEIEDLFLLVILHASSDIYFDPARVERDLWFLLNHGKPDMDIVWSRAQQWELSRALRRLLNRRYRQARSKPPGPFVFLANQAFWHDNFVTVLCGVAKYSYARLLDRLYP